MKTKEQLQAIRHIRYLIWRANKHYGINMVMPKVTFDPCGQRAGWANWNKWQVNFNPTLFADNVKEYYKETFAHEVAHLVVYFLYNPNGKYGTRYSRPRPHGEEWKSVMWECFKKEPERLHNMDVSKVKRHVKEYEYICPDCGKVHMLSGVRHNKHIRNSGKCYYCKCQNNHKDRPINYLVFTGKVK